MLKNFDEYPKGSSSLNKTPNQEKILQAGCFIQELMCIDPPRHNECCMVTWLCLQVSRTAQKINAWPVASRPCGVFSRIGITLANYRKFHKNIFLRCDFFRLHLVGGQIWGLQPSFHERNSELSTSWLKKHVHWNLPRRWCFISRSYLSLYDHGQR